MEQDLSVYIGQSLKAGVPEETVLKQISKTGLPERKLRQLVKKAKHELDRTRQQAHAQSPAKKEVDEIETRLVQLRIYIDAQIKRGTDKDLLKANLIKSGWTKEQMDAMFSDIAKEKDSQDIRRDEAELRKSPGVVIKQEYTFRFQDIGVKVLIYTEKGRPSLNYHLIIPVISDTTDLILERIRIKLIDEINLGSLELSQGDFEKLDRQVQIQILKLIRENFPHIGEGTQRFLASFLVSKVLGMGTLEILKADEQLEEIVVNDSVNPVYVYQKQWGWCRTNISINSDEKIAHLAGMIGRKIGREISHLAPLLDAHLPSGDRVNATLKPITANGPTITIRKFSSDPWTITKFLKSKTISMDGAALIWLAIQYELSAMIVGGTASGKTSCLNTLSSLIPPSQRVISIEDTREIRLPSYMHWVPMVSRQSNAEGKGGIEMEDLLINSLRMRPDRIIVGEVRKKVHAETLFEAIHTGHSVYSTFHANDAEEAVIRITNPPIDLPKNVLPALSIIIVQYRNRRSGLRRTFQIAEIQKDATLNIVFQYNPKKDILERVNPPKVTYDMLMEHAGMSREDIDFDLKEKTAILQYLLDNNLTSVEQVGKVMSLYYTEHDFLIKEIIGKKAPLK